MADFRNKSPELVRKTDCLIDKREGRGAKMDILYLSGYDYKNFIWFRPQQLMSRLSKHHRVLYIEPTRARKWKNARQWDKMEKVKNGLYVYSPIVMPLIASNPRIRKINQKILEIRIKSLLKKLSFKNVVTIVGTPFAGELAGKFSEDLIFYDCNDRWSSIPGLPSSFLRYEEIMLAKKSNMVFASAEGLVNDLKAFNPGTVCVPSGADIEHFGKALLSQTEIPEDIRNLPGPVVLSMGSVNKTKDDLKLLEALASKMTNGTLVIVGPVMEDVDLNRYPLLKQKAKFLGKRDYNQLPGYLKAADVCVVAYKKNEFTKYAQPTKIFEYLAAGKPVVCTEMPELKPYKEHIKIANGINEFIHDVKIAAEENSEEAVNSRVEFARGYSWDNLIKTMESHIYKCMDEADYEKSYYRPGKDGVKAASGKGSFTFMRKTNALAYNPKA